MALVIFSDDEDVSRHGAVLDTIHNDIVKRAKTPEPTILFEDKENIERGGPSGHSDDDEAFIPALTVDDYESLYEEPAELKMHLRPKREVWSVEDDLPLEDVQAIMRIDEATERKKLPKRRRQVEVGSSQSDSDMDLPLSHFVSARYDKFD
ncbi:unnamed protein product [Nippostrongylus brasiliensis]|uniref:DUF4604 domain-containing protein n=1 Tax=Nippostrongylus brasiliensis TaxID=27835 RepID=A0A0N4YRR9_NIPBR|nr:unnamed protein product [Nippostrongylus brasiliensis]